MNLSKVGQIICEARKAAGYTQRSLAEALFVTDKAVSKWERGICLPDLSLFSKISTLLDVDIEYLISEGTEFQEHDWVGELRISEIRGTVAGKPLIYYLLAYFMLAGIKKVAILTREKSYVNSLHLEQYGLDISFFRFRSDKTMVVTDKVLLFGVNVTRQFQNCMANEQSVFLALGDRMLPILFVRGDSDQIETVLKRAERKNLARGTICLPMRTLQEQKDAEAFVKMYEKNHGNKISDLDEIARGRGLK